MTLGVYDGETLRATWRFATDVERLPDEYGVLMLSLLKHDGVSPSPTSTKPSSACVVPDLEPVFEQVCRRYFNVTPLHVTAGVRTGLRILYDTPARGGRRPRGRRRGRDPEYGPPLIVVDLGTATVFDAISSEGDYLGGAIAPGLGIASEALFQARRQALPRGAEPPELGHRP